MTTAKRISAFKKESCDNCGLCLHLCPVMQLPLDVAKLEVSNLIEGKFSNYALTTCNSCLSCNLYCPQQANPYNLILERWNDRYRKYGSPPLYKFVCPTEQNNVWQHLNVFLSNIEKKWIAEWMSNVPTASDKVLLIGNYTHLFPFIIGDSKLLDYFKPIDKIDHWEGGAYPYQLGYLDLVEKIAKKTKKDLDDMGVKTVIPTLDAVHYIFKEVHPKEMGVNHDQTFINIHDWLLEKIESGEIKLPNKLKMSVTIHDNCYSKAQDGAYWDKPREILRKCGCEIIEMKHIKKDSLCCGFGTGCSWTSNISIPFTMISEGAKKFKESEDTGAQALISYCGGCIYLMWAIHELLESKIDLLHIIEVIRMAMGEKINYPQDNIERAWDIIAIITYDLLISTFKKNFFIRRIAYDSGMNTFKPKKYRLLKFIRSLFNISIIRKVYARMFRMMMPVMKQKKPKRVDLE